MDPGEGTDGAPYGVVVTGVTLDSRAVRPGDLYAALPGFTTHGAAFAAAAAASGAVAVLTDRAVWSGCAATASGCPSSSPPSRAPCSAGSPPSSTVTPRRPHPRRHHRHQRQDDDAYLVESGLRHRGLATGLIGTVETRVGGTRLPSARTTPEAPDLHALFARMSEEGVTAAVMEVSSHALAQHRVDGAVFDVALFTNLSQDHLDFHPSMEDYFQAKALLFTPSTAAAASSASTASGGGGSPRRPACR